MRRVSAKKIPQTQRCSRDLFYSRQTAFKRQLNSCQTAAKQIGENPQKCTFRFSKLYFSFCRLYIYFNAWEHDYMVDPLVALIGELHRISTNDKLQMSFAKVIANAGKIFSGILPSIGKTIAKKYAGEEAVDIIKDTLSETKKLFQHELDKYKHYCPVKVD